jgi:hypothetical protein
MRDPEIDHWREQFSAARRLKWQAEGLIMRLDDIADETRDEARWMRLLGIRRRARIRFDRRNADYRRQVCYDERD